MSSVAKILGRELPLDSVIYKGIPSMTAPEDNLFPVDPNQPQDSHGGWARKRQKLHHSVKSVQVAEESIEGWAAPYKTTMQKAASFTVPHSAGFTTAGAHMASVAAVAEANRSAARPPRPPQGAPRKMTSNRPPNQRSLLGYGYGITNHDESKEIIDLTTDTAFAPKRTLSVPAPLPPYARRRPLVNNDYHPPPPAKPPAIDPALAAHKLGAAKLPASKPAPLRDEPSSKEYPNFSSSPTRPPAEPSSAASTAGGSTTRTKDINKDMGKKLLEGDENVSPDDYRRPAANFHATTVTGPLGWRNGIKRPAALGRSGIAPMEKLNKPYKLTIKRS